MKSKNHTESKQFLYNTCILPEAPHTEKSEKALKSRSKRNVKERDGIRQQKINENNR